MSRCMTNPSDACSVGLLRTAEQEIVTARTLRCVLAFSDRCEKYAARNRDGSDPDPGEGDDRQHRCGFGAIDAIAACSCYELRCTS